jgi:cell division protease FtsH
MDRKRVFRAWWLWGLAGLLAVILLSSIFSGGSDFHEVKTSQVLTQISDGNVESATIKDKEQIVELTLKDAFEGHKKISASYPYQSTDDVYTALTDSKVAFTTKVSKDSVFVSLLVNYLPLLLLAGVIFFIFTQAQGGGSKVMSFGKSKAKLVSKDTPKTTFADVAGADEAIEELEEIKDFLQNPAKFQAIGAKIPKGVLLYGPPGTGKTLLARAVAGEAGVPFYSISGSDFVEMFVGVGASRVRDLFEQAKANAPAIIFVDEIDAVGRHRGAGMGGGHDEREQTLNQMLVEMDGFDVRGGVIMIAATNRPDILDPALLRPGRFDRQIAVGAPDIEGRKAVLAVHAKGKPFAPDVELAVIARRTPGFTGADLANVINEAALLTARTGGRMITMAALEESIDRVIAGPERKTRAMSDKEKRVTAYHEAGHALAAWAMPNLDPVHKVTILPRGRSLGHTLVLPLEDRYTQTRSEIIDQLVYALGGRAAEELVFHEPTTGASNDIEKATALAKSMVTEYGMSERLGAVKYGVKDGEPFLGRDFGHQRDYSEDVASGIDDEVRALIEGAHDEAWEILVQYRDVLDQLVLELVEKETLAKEDLERILAPVRKRPSHNAFNGFGKRTPSDKPPVEIPASSLVRQRGWTKVTDQEVPVGPNGAQPFPPADGNGQPYPAQPYPPQAYPGAPYPPQGPPGQQYPGQQYPPPYGVQPYPGQPPYPGQAYPGQTYPGQTYPGQPAYPQAPYPQPPAHDPANEPQPSGSAAPYQTDPSDPWRGPQTPAAEPPLRRDPGKPEAPTA